MNAVATVEQKAPAESPIAKFRGQLEQRLATFSEALPPQITPQRFKSIIMWAVTADPGLLAADRVSLFEACLAAANDGLLPDKKEGALVIYNTKVKEDGKEFWIKKVQWMPMIRGIFTKVYNTGQVKMAKVEVVYGGDRFRAWTDDTGDHIEYEEGEDQDRDIIRNAFALVVMKDGGVFVQTLKPADIEKIRAKSKNSGSGPWADWWEEMAKKSVFRRLAKRLPMAREIDQVISRDDYMYDHDDFHGDPQLAAHSRRAPIPPRPPAAMLGQPVARPVPMVQDDRELAANTAADATAETASSGDTQATPSGASSPGEAASSETPTDGAATSSAPSKEAHEGGNGAAEAEPPVDNPPPQAQSTGGDRKECIAKLLAIVTDKQTSPEDKEQLLAEAADMWTGALGDKAFVTEVFNTCTKVQRGELTAAKASKFLEAL